MITVIKETHLKTMRKFVCGNVIQTDTAPEKHIRLSHPTERSLLQGTALIMVGPTNLYSNVPFSVGTRRKSILLCTKA
jgi:ferredoxin-like protein FixX